MAHTNNFNTHYTTGNPVVDRVPLACTGNLGFPEVRPAGAFPAEGGRRKVPGGQQAVDLAARPMGVEHRRA